MNLRAAIWFVAAAIVATFAWEHVMTERRVSVPVRYSAEPDINALHGNPTLSGTELQRRTTGHYASAAPELPFLSRCRIAWQQDDGEQGYTVYSTGTGPTITFPERAPAGLRAIDAVRVLTTETESEVDVLWRVTLAGTDYYWDGAAWSVASVDASHWCTSAELAANLSSISLALARTGLGFKASLRTSVKSKTPYVFGVEMLWSIRHVTTSGNVLRHEDPRTEALIAVAAGLKTITVSTSEELTSDGSATLDYSTGLGDYARDVASIDAVYNVTDDPGMDSALSGTWDSGAKTYTLDAAPDSGDVIHTDLRYSPLVSLGGDADLFTDSLPLILIEQPRPLESRQSPYVGEMLDEDGSNVHVVRAPAREQWTLRVRVIAELDSDVRAITDHIREYLTTGETYGAIGKLYTLASSAGRFAVHWMGVDGPAVRRGDAYQQVIQLGVSGLTVWLGSAALGAAVSEVPVSPVAPVST